MKLIQSSRYFLFLSLLIVLVLLVAGMARADYSSNPDGTGQIIVGSGALSALNSASAPVALSGGGFDQVTLNIGSVANISGQDAIQFNTSNNILLNNGSVTATSFSFNAVNFISTTDALTNETVTNNGSLSGGPGAGLGTAGAGLQITTTGFGIGNISVVNNGSITGGIGNFLLGAGGAGVNIIAKNSGGSITNITLTNKGTITGGEGPGGNSGLGGYGIVVEANDSVGLVTITNSGMVTAGSGDGNNSQGGIAIDVTSTNGNVASVSLANTGVIIGGGNQDLGNSPAGAAVFVEATVGSVSSVQLSNAGTITGGAAATGNGGTGLFVYAGTDLSSVTFSNSGAIVGGSVGVSNSPGGGGGGVVLESNSGMASGITAVNTGLITGGNVVSGGAGGAGFGVIDNDTGINGASFTNSGVVTGGNGSGGGGGNAVAFSSTGFVSGLTITNMAAGTFIGGNDTGGDFAGNGILVNSHGTTTGLTMLNTGGITGGNGDLGGGNGILVTASGDLSGWTLVNTGRITGGNAIPGGAPLPGAVGGSGVEFTEDNQASNITFFNGGYITGGNGSGASGGAGIVVGVANFGSLSNFSITNTGSIIGGNDTIAGANGGLGIGIEIGFSKADAALSINNFGTIAGGLSGAGGRPGYAILAIGGASLDLTINNWGVISAGASQTPTAIFINGGDNTVNLNGHSAVNGLISATGPVDSNHLNLNFTGMSPAAIAQLKAQLAAQGDLTGHDSTGSFTVRGVTYTYDPFVLNINVSSYQLQGLTPNQQAVGASLDSVTSNPALGSPLGNLYNSIDLSGNVPGALEALSPQQYQAYGDLAIANTTAIVQNVDARLNNLRDGSESIDTTGVGGASDQQTTAGYSKDESKESKNVVQTPAPEKRWGMFAMGDGLFFRGSSRDANLQDDRSNSAGTLAGVDAKVGEHVVAGALFSYNNTDATLGSINNGGHATIESYSGGIYGSYHQDGFYVNGLAAYTRNHYSSDRSIVFPGFGANASANTNGNQESVNLDGGYDWHATDRLTLGPIAGLQYVHLDVNGFNEIGAGAADLNVNSQDMDSLQSRVGGRLNYHISTSQYSSFAADLHAAWQHEYLDSSRGIGASFVNSDLTPFSVQTTSPLRDAGVVGLGLNFTFHDRLTLFADYELLMWRSSSFEQTINGGGRISF